MSIGWLTSRELLASPMVAGCAVAFASSLKVSPGGNKACSVSFNNSSVDGAGLACGLAHVKFGFTGVQTVSALESNAVFIKNVSPKPAWLNETGNACVADDITDSATDMNPLR